MHEFLHVVKIIAECLGVLVIIAAIVVGVICGAIATSRGNPFQ